MDQITESQVSQFAKAQQLVTLPLSLQFEHFANYCCVAQHQQDTFDIDLISTGDFQGVDGLAIIVNGAIIDSKDAVDDLLEANGYVSATFVFVQAKTSSGFDLGEMSKFSESVLGFFRSDAHLIAHPDIAEKHEIYKHIYDYANKFKRGNPSVNLYYVTTGRWNDVPALRSNVDLTKQRLEDTNLFNEVTYVPVDAKTIQAWYRRTLTSRSVEIAFDKSIPLPSIPGVTEAFLGVLPAVEFLRFVDDGSGMIVKSVFYENIRDYQKGSEVNERIAETLTSGKADEFVLRNNGITIVAGNLNRTGTRFNIEDYQIVNGCQTSHVLFENKERLNQEALVPVKLIVTNDENVRSNIIVASNSHNKVVQEQLWALEDFQKSLESYFQSWTSDDEKLYYERRSRQYDSMPTVEKVRIITPGDLIKTYASMFLDEPHKAGRYYKELTEYIPQKRIFADDHKLKPYYVSAFAGYRLAWLFRNKGLDTRFKPFRFQILFALKALTCDPLKFALNSAAAEKACEPLRQTLLDVDLSEKVFGKAFSIVDTAITQLGHGFSRDNARLQPLRDKISQLAEAART